MSDGIKEDRNVEEETQADGMSACVKGFGCRPLAAVRHARAAGVRKPPREETAMGEGAAVSRALWGFERRGWCI